MSSVMNFRSRQIGFRTYDDYLNSPHWLEFSLKVKTKRCFCCGYKKNLQVHHVTYARLGKELPQDVVTVCGRCHVDVHELAASGTKLENAHYHLRSKIKQKVATNKDRWVDWTDLQNKSVGQSLDELHSFLESKGLIWESHVTAKAIDLGFARVTDEDEEQWNLKAYIRMMQADKKARKLAAKGRSVPPVVRRVALLEDKLKV